MTTTPTLVTTEAQFFLGKRRDMSFAKNGTHHLWSSFMPRRSEIKTAVGMEVYSIDRYPNGFFDAFDPRQEFERWATVKVSEDSPIPEGMELIKVPGGDYAVFHYQGRPSESPQFFQWVFNSWIPEAGFKVDDRPHIAVMGEKYKGEDPTSEEDIYIPIIR